MEIKLNGKETFVIMAALVTEVAVAFAALSKYGKELRRANAAEFKAWCRGCDVVYKDYRIKELEKKLAKRDLIVRFRGGDSG